MEVRSLIGLAALTVVTAGVAFNVSAIPRPVDNMINDWLGETISMSADGMFAVTGSSGKNNNAGQAYVYGRTGSTWSVIQTLTPPASTEYFGYKLAMSADASTIAVGASAAPPGVPSVTVFARSTGTNTWSRAQVLSPGNASPGDGCDDVTLSSDGSILASSAIWHSNDLGVTQGTGGAWVWKRVGGQYVQQGGTLRGSVSSAYFHFGASAALSADGNVLVITSERAAVDGQPRAGAAYVYTAASNWALVQNLTATDAQARKRFGTVARLSYDGTVMAIGAVEVGGFTGAVYIFTRSSNTWTQTARLNDTSGSGRRGASFGTSVSLAPDASWLLVGSPSSNCSLGSCGSVQVFNRTASGGWQQYPNYLVTQDIFSSSFGTCVAGSSSITPGSGSSWALMSDPFNGPNSNGALYAVDLATLIPPSSSFASVTQTATVPVTATASAVAPTSSAAAATSAAVTMSAVAATSAVAPTSSAAAATSAIVTMSAAASTSAVAPTSSSAAATSATVTTSAAASTSAAATMSASPTSMSSASSTWSTGAIAPMAAPRSAEPISTGGAVGLAIGAAVVVGVTLMAIVLLRRSPRAPVAAAALLPTVRPASVV